MKRIFGVDMKNSVMLAVLIIGIFISPVFANEQKSEGWDLSLGVGMLYNPKYEGDDDYQLSIVPNVRITYEDKFFASSRGCGYNIINENGWRVGPISKLNFGRNEDGSNPFTVGGDDTNDLQGLGDIDMTVELGGGVEYSWESISAQVELRQAVSGHEGFIGDLGIKYNGILKIKGPPIIYSIGPRLKFGNSKYNQEFFGITDAQSNNSGLPIYDLDGGLVSYGVGAMAIMPIAENITLNFMLGYDRLANDISDSPLIKERGSADQSVAGIFLSYYFALN